MTCFLEGLKLHFIDSVKSSVTVINFEIKVGEMMKYEKSCYCVLFREMDDEHIVNGFMSWFRNLH